MNKGDKDDHPMKLKDKFTELKNRHEGALIAYICAGDPTPEDTERSYMHWHAVAPT
jgi:tryptophan synthase alpha subunit